MPSATPGPRELRPWSGCAELGWGFRVHRGRGSGVQRRLKDGVRKGLAQNPGTLPKQLRRPFFQDPHLNPPSLFGTSSGNQGQRMARAKNNYILWTIWVHAEENSIVFEEFSFRSIIPTHQVQ